MMEYLNGLYSISEENINKRRKAMDSRMAFAGEKRRIVVVGSADSGEKSLIEPASSYSGGCMQQRRSLIPAGVAGKPAAASPSATRASNMRLPLTW